MPGAGSLRLANELYNVLPKDGTALGMIGEVLVIDRVLGDPQARAEWDRSWCPTGARDDA